MTLSEQLSIDLLHLLRPILAALRTRRADLADQLERAATSAALNTAEAGGRAGRDSVRVLRIASGEAREAKRALTVAQALGYADAADIDAAWRCADRLCGVLFGLVRKLG